MILHELTVRLNGLEWNDMEFKVAQSMAGRCLMETAATLAHLDTQMLLEKLDASLGHVVYHARPHLGEAQLDADLLADDALLTTTKVTPIHGH